MESSPSEEHITAAQPNWLELPEELTINILHRLGPLGILDVGQIVCKTWYRLCKDPLMWRSIYLCPLMDMPSATLQLYIRSVERSSGLLNDIRIDSFVSNELLLYIAMSASQLRSLKLCCCWIIFEKGFVEVAKNLPNLEELHLKLTPASRKSLESFGEYCPRLKSFKYDRHSKGDEEALAIAQTMTGLRHLKLSGSQMTNNGLQAILNRCIHLESIYLKNCVNIDLREDVGRSCSRRIKNLKFVTTPDPEWRSWYDSLDSLCGFSSQEFDILSLLSDDE